jgi:selenocysteine lyase/cysteine desulfurase
VTAPTTLDDLVAREFPRLQRDDAIYLNSAATGPLPERALRVTAAHNELRAEPWRYTPEVQFGTLTRSRDLVARLINASPEEVALTVNTSYGINLAARALPLVPGDVVVGTDRDFPANVYPWMALEKARGVQFRQVPCDGRLFDEDALVAALDEPRVKVLAVSWVSFETGARLDLDRLGQACRERGVYFVVDAMQGLGALTLDVRRTPIDILSCGGQKWLCAPWGSAFAWIRRELIQQLEPQHVGWMSVKGSDDFSRMLDYALEYRENARRFELITLPYQDFAGFNASLEVLHEAGPAAIAERVLSLTTQIVEWARDHPSVRLVTNEDPARRAGIVSLMPPDPGGTSARLTARGITHSLREGALRLAPHFFTPREHIATLLRELSASS